MCASVNRNKNHRAGTSSRNSSRRSSIAGSARSVRSTRNEELHKLLGDRPKPAIANFTGHPHEPKKEMNAHMAPKPHMDHKKDLDKGHGADKKALKKVKKPEGKGFLGKLMHRVKSLFA